MNSKPSFSYLHPSIPHRNQIKNASSKSNGCTTKNKSWYGHRVKLSSKTQQLNMSSILDSDSKTEDDIYAEWILKDERGKWIKFPISILEDSCSNKIRRDIHKWIFHYGTKFKQAEITIQNAMVYIDKLIWRGEISDLEQNKELWAVTSLLVSSKFIEHDLKLIKIDDVLLFIRGHFCREDIMKCELSLCTLLDWQLDVICPSYFRGIILKESNTELDLENEIFSHNDTLGML